MSVVVLMIDACFALAHDITIVLCCFSPWEWGEEGRENVHAA